MAGRTYFVGVVIIACLVSGGVVHAGTEPPANCGIFDASSPPFAGGTGNPGSPYQVAKPSQLAAITGFFLDCDFIQTANFGLPSPWMPIGDGEHRFTGDYDGNGLTIKGLTTGDPTASFQGLFAGTDGATISNLSLTKVSVTGFLYVGGLTGNARNTDISNVTVTGTVTGTAAVGGVVGLFYGDGDRPTISNVTSWATVTGTAPSQSATGGITGSLLHADMSTVLSYGSVQGVEQSGGLVGYVADEATIRYSRARGAVSGTTTVGGLVGELWTSLVADSYATGSVSAAEGGAGGIAGRVVEFVPPVSRHTLENVYARGVVTAPIDAGGLIGTIEITANVVQSFWNKSVNDPAMTAYGSPDDVVTDIPGSTIAELRDIDTFTTNGATWTITDTWEAFVPPSTVWGICDGIGTPYLLWEVSHSPCEWMVTGFFQPVDMGEVINVAQAGRVVPLKWRVLGGDGLPVSDPSSFVKIESSLWACADAAGTVEDGVENYSVNSGLRYLGDGHWQFNWATPKSYAGQCRTVTVTLSDGSTISAKFRFRR